MDPFVVLDSDTIANLLTFLPPVDVIRLQRVSRRWHQLLSSKWISRLALVSHFPHCSEAMELRGGNSREDPVRSYRRAVYRSYTRAMGRPSRIQSFVLETGGGILEWGTAGDFVCWVARTHQTLFCQRVSGGRETRRHVSLLDVVRRNGLQISQDDIANSLLRLQIGDEVLSVTLNCYDAIDDDDGSGRRAFILVFELENLRFLWYQDIQLPYKMLGEPDTAKDNFIYVRKTIRESTSPAAVAAAAPLIPYEDIAVHLMVHDLRTGQQKAAILLERGDEIAKGDLFFIVVSDSSFKRLVVLFERGLQPEKAHVTVYTRVYSLLAPAGRLLAEYKISGNHSSLIPRGRYHQVRANSSVCVDYPSRLEKFDIVESLFVTAMISAHERDRTGTPDDPDEPAIPDDPEADLLRLSRTMTGRLGLYAPIHLCPPVIPYAVWEVSSPKTRPENLQLTPRRYLAELSMDRDFFSGNDMEPALVGMPEMCNRFEVFLPLEDCSAVFAQRGRHRFVLDVACYEQIDEDTYRRKYANRTTTMPGTDWVIPRDVESNEFFAQQGGGQRTKLLRQCSRHPLTAKRLESPATTTMPQKENEKLEDARPYEIDPKTGEIKIKGRVDTWFLPSVQWSEKCFTIRTSWTEKVPGGENGERADVTGIVVLDFSPPW